MHLSEFLEVPNPHLNKWVRKVIIIPMQLLCHLRGESSIDDPEDVAILVGTYVGSAIVFPQVAKESDVVELNSSLLSMTQVPRRFLFYVLSVFFELSQYLRF